MVSILTRIFDLVAPRTCSCCGNRLSPTEEYICVNCLLDFPRTNFQFDPYENSMAHMFRGKFPVERCGAFFYYSKKENSVHAIHDFKYHHMPALAVLMGRMVAHEYVTTAFFDGIDGIVPVPLSKASMLRRGYNQCYHLAVGIQEVTGLPILRKVVGRRRFRGSQTKRSSEERWENVKDVFYLKEAAQAAHRHLLLIDDVVTTGATLCACAQAILPAGDVRFSILTIGMVRPS